MDSPAPSGSKSRPLSAAAARAATRRIKRPIIRPSASTATTRSSSRRASSLSKIPVPLIRAIIKSESDYDPHVVSSMDCKGLMQVHPQVYIDIAWARRAMCFDPRTNIMTGTRLLRWLANHVDGDLVLTIAGYHAGLGSLAKYGYTVPPYAYTRQYLKTVLDRYYQYKAEEQRAKAR